MPSSMPWPGIAAPAACPRLTVNWGYLGEVGYLARRSELGERLERQGVLSFTVRQALALLEKAMQRQHVQVSVMRVEWSRWRGLGVTGRVSPRFAHLCGQADAGHGRAVNGALPGRDAILAADPEGRPGLLGALLRDKVARVLGTSPDRLDGDRPLLQLGIDSLMAVELRNWLEGELQVDLPIVELMRSPSVSGLAELLAERLETRRQGPVVRSRPQRHGERVGQRSQRPRPAAAWRRRRPSCSPASMTSPATRSMPSWPRSWTRKAMRNGR